VAMAIAMAVAVAMAAAMLAAMAEVLAMMAMGRVRLGSRRCGGCLLEEELRSQNVSSCALSVIIFECVWSHLVAKNHHG
jgi:hypothetical protein